jgi:seryl-tRNA synthetase
MYATQFLRKREYTAMQPPYFMNKEVMAGVAQLEEFDEALYHVGGGDEDGGKYLIATSEQPICAYHKDEWLQDSEMPKRYAGVSACFRKEAGSSGRDVWGIFRVHQFDKVEQFILCDGDLETSKKYHEEILKTAEEFLQSLGLPYHVVNIVSGELNNAAIKKYDVECWFPGYETYRELVSCSNCTDYQSRSMNTRCGVPADKKYCHMLNSTLCACTRAICCILENYQVYETQEDGTVKGGVNVPEVLQPYMGGMDYIPFVREAQVDASAKAAKNTAKKGANKQAKKAAAPPKAPK